MKIKTLFSLFILIAASGFAAEKIIGGPKGGRLLDTAPHKAEFHISKDRKAEITFYDAALKPVAGMTQVVAITAEPKSGRVKVEMEKTATGFISKSPIPAADDPYRIVVQIREKPDATPKNFRIDLDLSMCAECKRAEYACTCDH